tara:strand:+ start:233 stop:610 length:378 start_codon:yes stop_codon:yes gene_type:complete
MGGISMSKYLIHIHSGPDMKNKATLGMLVAITAFKNNNDVNIFLGADGVHLLSIKEEGKVVGQGTGDLKTHLDFLKENKIKLYVSGMSSKARGYDESLLSGFNAEFSMPDRLLTLSLEAHSTLCY